MDDRLYFRQLLAGRDFARADPVARQMVNFVYLIGDRETGEAVVIDPAYDIQGLLDVLAADGMRLTGALATHYHPDHIGGSMMGFDIAGIDELLDARAGADPRAGRRGAVDHAGHRRRRLRPRRPRQRRHRDGRRDPDRADPHARATRRAASASSSTAASSAATPSSSRAAGAPTCPAATRPRCTRASPRSWPRCPTTRCCSPATSTPPEPSATMAETRRWNYVFKPGSEAEWLAMFGQ